MFCKLISNDTRVRFAIRCVAVAMIAFAGGLPTANAVVVVDNFDDLNDTSNPAWTHLDALVGSTGQSWTVSDADPGPGVDGEYRLQAPANGVIPIATEFNFLGFAGIYVQPSFTDVRVQADFVDFRSDPALDVYWYGVGARLNGSNNQPSIENGFEMRGYGYEYAPGDGAAGELVLVVYNGSGNRDVGSQMVVRDEAKDNRFVLEVIGHVLHGQVFEIDSLGNEVAMVGERFRDFDAQPFISDHDGNPNTPDELHVPYESGFSGIYGVGYILSEDVDFTIDNFRTESIGGLTGDYNEDGIVNAADYSVWRNNVGSTDTLQNDDIGGLVGTAHYNQWKAAFGNSGTGSGLGSASVPEPASAAMCLIGLVGLWFGRRRAS